MAKFNDRYATRVPEGKYEAAFLRVEECAPHGSLRWVGIFEITDEGEHCGKELRRYWNPPKGPRLARNSSLFLDYVAVTGSRPPTKGIAPANFLRDCRVGVYVTTVDRRPGRKGEKKWVKNPEALWYSKIEYIDRLTLGAPPCMRGRARATPS